MIPLHRPFVGAEELEEIESVLKSGWLAQGPKVAEFEEMVKSYLGVQYAVACSSCTTALHLSLLSIGVEKDDEVLVADYTYPATGHAVMHCGATPIFIDIDPKTYNIDPQIIEAHITKKTKAIIPVHTFGQCADMDSILTIANKYGINIIEDAACAMGSKYKNKFAGTMGDINCFSFHATKGVGIGEGGIITTNNEKLANKARKLAFFGIESSWVRQSRVTQFMELGYNYKLSDVSAAIAICQMRKLDTIIERKRYLAKYWDEKLAGLNLITIPYVNNDCFHNYQGYSALLSKCVDRDLLMKNLLDRGLQTQIGTYASHMQPVYKYGKICSNSLDVYNRSLRLPMYYELTESMIDEAFTILKEVIYESCIS